MNNETVGYRFKKALELKYGHINNAIIAEKYNYTPQGIGQQKVKKAINETIAFICGNENINLNWIQTGKGEIFINSSTERLNNVSTYEQILLEDIPKLLPKQQEYYYHRVKADLLENEKSNIN